MVKTRMIPHGFDHADLLEKNIRRHIDRSFTFGD